MTKTSFSIASRPIGSGSGPLVIAEMSANHNGSLDRALQIVREAARNGAGAIKLQTFTPSTLTIKSNRPEFYINDPESLWYGRKLWDLYEEAHTPWEWHEPIFAEARAEGLACVSTAFDEQSLKFVVGLGVDAVKISSFELVHLPLIKLAARAGKPILLSTGMATLEEIDDAVEMLRANGCREFALLKCTSAYPSDERDANLLAMQELGKRYNCEVGLSDHCLRPYASFAAVALGAAVIEKHVTLDRSVGGVDAPFSLEPQELKELVEGTELVWRSRGAVLFGGRGTEATSLKERPSVYVVRPIRRGEAFSRDNIRVIRPGNGLPAKVYEELLAKSCTQDVAEGTPMSWDFVSEGRKLQSTRNGRLSRSEGGRRR